MVKVRRPYWLLANEEFKDLRLGQAAYAVRNKALEPE